MSFLLPIHLLTWSAAVVLLGVSVGTDLRDRIIPNELVLAIVGIGLAQAILARPGLLWLSLLLAALVFCTLGILSHYKIIGGGDLKLISAVTLLVAPDRVGQLLAAIALAGGVLSCFYLAAHVWLNRLSAPQTAGAEIAPTAIGLAAVFKSERARIAAGNSLPYALAVAGGAGLFIARESFQCVYTMSCSL
jgi:prepilin peptidase CpaA